MVGALLVSNKNEVSPIWKSLSVQYKSRITLGFITLAIYNKIFSDDTLTDDNVPLIKTIYKGFELSRYKENMGYTDVDRYLNLFHIDATKRR